MRIKKTPPNTPPDIQISTVKPGSHQVATIPPQLSKEEKELTVPPEIKTNFVSSYDPAIMQQIIIDIATTDAKVDDICVNHGVNPRTAYLWRSQSAELLQAWLSAMKHRTHVRADHFETDVKDLDTAIDDKEADYRIVGNKIRRFDKVWGHREWFMKAYNRQFFGDKLDSTQEVTVNVAKAREEAYSAFQSAQIADYEEVVVPPDVKVSGVNNTQE